MSKLLISKYNITGDRCVDACLSYGELRYLDKEGLPINIEVPYDKYEEALTDFNERINEGLVNRNINPNDVLAKGSFTYNQVKNIAVLNKIKGLSVFEIDGSIETDNILGIAGCIEYALAIWNGEEKEDALEKAVIRSIKIHGSKFIKSLNIEGSYEDISNKINQLEKSLYRINIYTMEEELYADIWNDKSKFKNGLNVVIGIAGALTGFILVQGFTSFGSILNNISLHWGLSILSMIITSFISIKVSKSISYKYIKNSNTPIIELFNEEIEQSILSNLLTESEYNEIVQNITKGEISKLIVDIRGSVNKKVSVNKVVVKETEFTLESRRSVIIPNDYEIKEMTEKVIKKLLK